MNADTVIAISAGVIALSSLGVSIWSAALTRKHNRLSVTPHLKIDYFHTPDESIRVVLVNSGLGTALIRRFTVCLDGLALSSIEAAGLKEAMVKIGLAGSFYAILLWVTMRCLLATKWYSFLLTYLISRSKKWQPEHL